MAIEDDGALTFCMKRFHQYAPIWDELAGYFFRRCDFVELTSLTLPYYDRDTHTTLKGQDNGQPGAFRTNFPHNMIGWFLWKLQLAIINLQADPRWCDDDESPYSGPKLTSANPCYFDWPGAAPAHTHWGGIVDDCRDVLNHLRYKRTAVDSCTLTGISVSSNRMDAGRRFINFSPGGTITGQYFLPPPAVPWGYLYEFGSGDNNIQLPNQNVPFSYTANGTAVITRDGVFSPWPPECDVVLEAFSDPFETAIGAWENPYEMQGIWLQAIFDANINHFTCYDDDHHPYPLGYDGLFLAGGTFQLLANDGKTATYHLQCGPVGKTARLTYSFGASVVCTGAGPLPSLSFDVHCTVAGISKTLTVVVDGDAHEYGDTISVDIPLAAFEEQDVSAVWIMDTPGTLDSWCGDYGPNLENAISNTPAVSNPDFMIQVWEVGGVLLCEWV